MKRILKSNKGFTLIELLVVIAILAVLATLYVPRIVTSTTQAKRTVEIANARTLASEITLYNATHATKITGTASKGTALGTEYGAGYTQVQSSDLTGTGLLEGRNFPSSTYVAIMIDSTGNCFIVDPDGVLITEATPTLAP